jgi:crotonobetainyl-CoA:carnitine CoA-transferase CaiB-like acyl-CoA transferase
VKPLEGIRVLDVSRIVSGPTCCFYLAALGAEVIRVEGPGGDMTWVSPPFVGPAGVHRGPRGPRDVAISPLRKGRGKRSVVLDLKLPAGREALLRLVAESDVLVENFTPGTMAALGLDYASLEPVNPRLVHCSITGYGPDGPYRDRPSMDLAVQALSGLMAKTGFPDGPPTKIGATVGDQIPAMFAALGIVAALRQRDHDGRGQHVDVAMLDGLLSILWDEPLDEYEDRGVPPRIGNGDPRGAPLDCYPTKDGWIALVCTSDAQFVRIAELLDRLDWLERFPTIPDRAAGRDEINDAVKAWTALRTSAEAAAAFDGIAVPSGIVNPPWVGRRDPHVAHRGALEPLRHPDLDEPSPFLGARLPIRLSRADTSTTPAEPLGASTEAVLREVAGLTPDEIAELRSAGALG